MENVRSTTISVPNTRMLPGRAVEVVLAGGERVKRVVWEVGAGLVFVCTEKAYENLSRGQLAAQPIGFPLSDVRALA